MCVYYRSEQTVPAKTSFLGQSNQVGAPREDGGLESTDVTRSTDIQAPSRKRKYFGTSDLVQKGIQRVLSAGPPEQDAACAETDIDQDIFTNARELPRPPWGSGFGHALVVFNGKLFVLGGKGLNGYLDEMWYSTDCALSWQRFPSLPWQQRKGHAVVATSDHFCVLGGCGSNGKYSSTIFTFSVTETVHRFPLPLWGKRHGHQAVHCNGRILVLGGGIRQSSTVVLNDVWKSHDGGESWSQLPNAPWPGRVGHQACVCGDRILVTGGSNAKRQPFSDIWASDDYGLSWYALPRPPWKARAGHQTVAVSSESLILCGGIDSESQYLGDSWASNDSGFSWIPLTVPPWSALAFHQMVVLEDQLVVLGGLQENPENSKTGLICQDAWVVSLN